jgi:RNA polymerase sigma-70 factor (ECF subfamily)
MQDGTGLLRRVARGDGAAFEALYAAHARRLRRIAFAVLRDEQDSADVLQDVFLRVWTGARAFDRARGQADTWLNVLCRSRAIDRLRGRVRGERARRRSRPPPPQSSRDRDTQILVRELLRRVPRERRRLLEMAYVAGFTHEELARRFKAPLGTIKSRLRLGIDDLRSALHRSRA